MNKQIRNFLLPKLSKRYFLRLLLVAVGTYLFFRFICIPARIRGISMEPTYRNGGIACCWRPSYWFSEPQRYDVVMVRFAGTRFMLLKRIVALEGETVAFENGQLLVNAEAVDEPYVQYNGNWNLAPRLIEPGNVYLVGDNRSMYIDEHVFGQTSKRRIIGVPLW